MDGCCSSFLYADEPQLGLKCSDDNVPYCNRYYIMVECMFVELDQ